MQEILEEQDPMEDLHTLVEESILEEPPISIRDGNMIRDGYNSDVDKYRTAKTEGKTWLAQIETKERERTGIKNMKIKFNKVFGYYLEVTNSYKDLVPDDYYPQADSDKCRAVNYAGIKRTGRYHSGRGREADRPGVSAVL